MHILAIIVGLLGAGIVWWWRLQMIARAGNAAIDTARRVRGEVRRKRSREKAALAPVSAIDQPLPAAATLMRFVAGDEGWPRSRAEARRLLGEIADEAQVDEAITYAEWCERQVLAERKAIDTLCAKLAEWLDPTERERMAGMVEAMAADDDADARARAERATGRIRDAGRPV